MAMEIENQGRHDGEGFGELARDLWGNKPLLIALLAGVFVLVYVIAKNQSSAIAAPGGTTNPAGSNGTYLIVNDNQPPPVNVTVNAPAPTSGSGGTTTPVLPPGGILPPTRINGGSGSSSSGGSSSKPRTVTVAHWPAQDSTLWGIAQHYGYGSNWQTIYKANQSKIGSNPQLIHPGMVLSLP